MLIKKISDIPPSEITPERGYRTRREFMKRAAALGLAGTAFPAGELLAQNPAARKLPSMKSTLSTSEEPTRYKDVTTYNNFYEFGIEKHEPALNAHRLKTRPWSVMVDGEVKRKGPIDIEHLLELAPME